MQPPSSSSSSTAKFLTAPTDITRFLQLTRSSSRSLSPQRELLQMTAQLLRSTAADAPRGPPAAAAEPEGHHAAYLLQCGSPLYDPVRGGWRCWNGHELRAKLRAQYDGVEGVSCDFCGFTDWAETPQAQAEPQPQPQAQGRAGRKRRKAPKEKPAEAATPLCLYHCDVCDMDLCARCAAELRDDARYHVPCLQCRGCGLFMRDAEAVVHRCRAAVHREPAAGGGASSSSRTTEGAAAPAAVDLREPSPVPSSPAPRSACEVCVTTEGAAAEALVRRIGAELEAELTDTPELRGQLVFRTATKLAAEEFAQRVHEAGLFAAIRRFRVQ